jgi:peroxiredoxin Q/BCP
VAVFAAGLFLWFALQAEVTLRPGDQAPDFELLGSDGQVYRLSALRGRPVVLAWFPRAFSPFCTTQCESLRDHQTRIQTLGVAYLAASLDDPATNRTFARAIGAGYPILSDPSRRVARAYGVVGRLQPWASRWTFYIGSDGRILHIDRSVDVSTAGEDVLARLASLGLAPASGIP